MHPGLFLYKILNRVSRADITRVLMLDTRTVAVVPNDAGVKCQWIDIKGIEALVHDEDFKISRGFVDDFKRLGFRGVSASADGVVVGVLFLVPDSIAARHNSGGAPFKGIGLDLPDSVFYLFKVAVKPQSRGKKINAAMISFAINQLDSDTLDTLVTTTDWTNLAFLKSVENYGFKRFGFASEFVVRGRHYYQLPTLKLSGAPGSIEKPVTSVSTDNRTITFTRE